MGGDKNVKLSKTILDMKFMKRTKERVEKEADDAVGREMYSKNITEEMKKSGNTVFVEASSVHCLRLVDGRFSFGGMNPDIEKLMLNDYNKNINLTKETSETDISDAKMMEHYNSLTQTISNKFNNRKRKSNASGKPSNT